MRSGSHPTMLVPARNLYERSQLSRISSGSTRKVHSAGLGDHDTAPLRTQKALGTRMRRRGACVRSGNAGQQARTGRVRGHQPRRRRANEHQVAATKAQGAWRALENLQTCRRRRPSWQVRRTSTARRPRDRTLRNRSRVSCAVGRESARTYRSCRSQGRSDWTRGAACERTCARAVARCDHGPGGRTRRGSAA